MKKVHIRRLLLAALVLTLAAAAAVGTAFARYRITKETQLRFSVQKPDSIALQASTESKDAPRWQASPDGVLIMPFCVTAAENNQKTQQFTVRLYSSLQASFTLTESEAAYTGQAVEIEEDSALYREFGPGWVYTFHAGGAETGAQEALWSLPVGGNLMFTLSTGEAVANPLMTELRVVCMKEVQP